MELKYIFIETPSDLQMQPSTRSEYKRHNTSKCLIGCTLMVLCVLYHLCMSGLFQTWNLLECLASYKVYPQVVILKCPSWLTRGFTVCDQLSTVGVDLNIPSFVTGGKQLTEAEILHTWKVASVRIHIKWVIGHIKKFCHPQRNSARTMAHLANQIVYICAWLSSFQPSLVPPPQNDNVDSDVE